jgi:asparagine N-glycosylation enzyme membrane subunit Stt3
MNQPDFFVAIFYKIRYYSINIIFVKILKIFIASLFLFFYHFKSFIIQDIIKQKYFKHIIISKELILFLERSESGTLEPYTMS